MRRRLRRAVLVAACGAAFPGAAAPSRNPAVVPFEIANGHVFVKTRVAGRELSFVLDTGAPVAIVDSARARELGLATGPEFAMHGAGANVGAAPVENVEYELAGLPGFRASLELASPLQAMAPALGRDIDGVLGASFLRRFVVEIDWRAKALRLHDPSSFAYRGGGAIVPFRLRHGHPVVHGAVTAIGGARIEGDFLVDLGSNGEIDLRAPFVAAHGLPGANVPTIALDAIGAGGPLRGVLGRVESFELGGIRIRRPLTAFSKDTAGVNSLGGEAGSIGQRILARFTVYFDYGRERMILEPHDEAAAASERAFSGLTLRALGRDYRTFTVAHVVAGGAAEKAGIRESDVIAAIDGRPAAAWTLTEILDLFEKPEARSLLVRRRGRERNVVLTPGRLV